MTSNPDMWCRRTFNPVVQFDCPVFNPVPTTKMAGINNSDAYLLYMCNDNILCSNNIFVFEKLNTDLIITLIKFEIFL